MADPRDVAATKMCRREFTRKGVDVSAADIRVMHGVCYLKGQIKMIMGEGKIDLKEQVQLVARILRSKQGINDVIVDVNYKF